jgi:fatty acid desaturase
VHAHPTRSPLVNELLVFPSLWLWMPYRIYRETHLAHHHNEILTDPLLDPESYYVTPEAWRAAGPVRRALLTAHNTALGRLLLGPAVSVWRLLVSEAKKARTGTSRQAAAWVLHAVGCGLVLAWVVGVCDIAIGEYLLLYAYPGLSLTLLRSFLEHQARKEVGERSVLIEAGPVMSLLYLNNNLHALHHAAPGVAWYRLPALYRDRRDSLLAANGGYRFRGYGEVLARYLFRTKEPVAHPLPVNAPA